MKKLYYSILVLFAYTNGFGQSYPLIMVGKAFKDKKCTSGSATSTFSDGAGYIISFDCASPFDYTGQQNKLKTDVATKYSVTSTNTSITTSSTKSTVVIIKYDKPISGWNCTVARYAVGFGNGLVEAQADAVKNKELDHKSSTWTFVEEVSCSTILSTENENIIDNSLKAFPNPTNNILNLSNSSNYQIFDTFGMELLNGNGDKIDVSKLPSGIYLIKLGFHLSKFVKE